MIEINLKSSVQELILYFIERKDVRYLIIPFVAEYSISDEQKPIQTLRIENPLFEEQND